MLVKLICWVGAYILQRKTQKFCQGCSKETPLEVNADKTKYMVISQDHNAEQSHNKRQIITSLKVWKSSNIWKQPICEQP